MKPEMRETQCVERGGPLTTIPLMTISKNRLCCAGGCPSTVRRSFVLQMENRMDLFE